MYLLTVPVFFGIDMLWLGVIAKDYYRNSLSAYFTGEINWPAAIVFYLIYIVGILIFAAVPAIRKDSVVDAALFGALFGFFAYATYDLTNYATLKNWPLNIVIVDIIWGAVLTGLVSLAAFYIGKWVL